jgi:putative transposase
MKKLKLSEAKIMAVLGEGEAGIAIEDLCRKYEISRSTYYKLKTKYGGMNGSDLRRLRQLEEENLRLKQMYADLSLDHKILKDVVEKKLESRLSDEN